MVHPVQAKEGGELVKTTKLVLLVIIAVALVVLVLQNTNPVQARFLWMVAEVPAIVLLFLTALGGFVAGVIVAMLVKREPGQRVERG